MLLEKEKFLAGLERLPKTLCHGDTFPTNFRSRSLNGEESTLAMDWALVGIAPIGDDLGQLMYGAFLTFPGADKRQIDGLLFDSYLEGLKDEGCHVDPLLVRFGFTTSAALRVGLFILITAAMEPLDARSAGEASDSSAVEDCFEIAMAREAYRLLDLTG
jgi:hypothetical protein